MGSIYVGELMRRLGTGELVGIARWLKVRNTEDYCRAGREQPAVERHKTISKRRSKS